MTEQEQIEDIAKYVCNVCDFKCDWFQSGMKEDSICTTAQETAEALYSAGYRKVDEIKRLEKENEQLKAKLEKNPLAIKQKIMEEDDYELTEREQATLFLDRMESDVEILHDIVENLDELLGKGIDEYIKGIDGVEGIKDMWERSAVMAFAEKVKEYINDNADFVYKSECGEYAEINITLCEKYIDELLKEYE